MVALPYIAPDITVEQQNRAAALRMLIEHHVPHSEATRLRTYLKNNPFIHGLYHHRKMVVTHSKDIPIGGLNIHTPREGVYEWDIYLPADTHEQLSADIAAIFEENGLKPISMEAGPVEPGYFAKVENNYPGLPVISTQWFIHGDDLTRILPAIRREYDQVVSKHAHGR